MKLQDHQLESNEADVCRNCQHVLQPADNFCSNCSQRVHVKRFTVRSIFAHIFSVIVNVDRGFTLTLRDIFLRPAEVVHGFVGGNVTKYYNPFRFIFWLSTASVVIGMWLGIYDMQQATMEGSLTPGTEDVMAQTINEKVKEYMTFIILSMVPFLSAYSLLFYRKRSFNYAEHMIMTCYAFGATAAAGILMFPLYMAFPSVVLYSLGVGMLVTMALYGYILSAVFDHSIIKGIINGLLIYLLGYVTMFLIAGILALGVMLLLIATGVLDPEQFKQAAEAGAMAADSLQQSGIVPLDSLTVDSLQAVPETVAADSTKAVARVPQ